MRTATSVLLFLAIAACGGSSDTDMGTGTDSGGSEAGTDLGSGTDSGPPDMGSIDLGTDMPMPVLGTATCSELMAGTDSCGMCIGTSCCTEYDACKAAPACQTFLTCANACMDSACIGTCLTAAGSDTATMNFVSCVQGPTCMTDCSG